MLANREHFQIVALEVALEQADKQTACALQHKAAWRPDFIRAQNRARILNVIGFSKLSPKLACGIGAVAYALNMTNSSGQHCCSVAHLVPVEL